MNKIYLAGGCFWGTQHFFSLVNGVTSTKVVYVNGTKENPSYEEVCSKKYKFAEAVEVEYNENIVSLKSLLQKFFITIDPTSLNKQGGDRGLQYRTGIYYLDENSKEVAKTELENLQEKHKKKIQIELKPLDNFYLAESYHQDYLYKNPTGYCHIPLDVFDKAND